MAGLIDLRFSRGILAIGGFLARGYWKCASYTLKLNMGTIGIHFMFYFLECIIAHLLIHVCAHDWASSKMLLRGHLGVPDTVSEPLIVPLNYLVILHLIHLKAYSWKMYRFKGIPSTWLQKLNASTGVGIVHLRPPNIPLRLTINPRCLYNILSS